MDYNKSWKGKVGITHIEDGPLDQSTRPHKKGSSRGSDPMEVSKYPCTSKSGPITQRARNK